MITWFEIGDINDHADDVRPYYGTGVLVNGEQPILAISNTNGEDGGRIGVKGLVLFDGYQLPIPSATPAAVSATPKQNGEGIYTSRDEKYALRLVQTTLLLGVNDSVNGNE